MIEKDEVAELIHGAVPSFRSSDEFTGMVDLLTDDEGNLLHFPMATQLVRHLVALRLAGETEPVDAAFALTERFIREGSDYARNLAVVGILEDLQNTNLHLDGSAPADFLPYLRPWSRWYWDEIALFWEGKIGRIGTSGRPRPDGMPD